MMAAPNTGLDFLALFNGYSESRYKNPIPLKDTAVGFSIQKSYPSGIRFKPAKDLQVDEDVAVIWVV
jgi:hypothetical protein